MIQVSLWHFGPFFHSRNTQSTEEIVVCIRFATNFGRTRPFNRIVWQQTSVRCSQQFQIQNVPRVLVKRSSCFSTRCSTSKCRFPRFSGVPRGGLLDKRRGLHRMLFLRFSLKVQFHPLVLLQKPFSLSCLCVPIPVYCCFWLGVGSGVWWVGSHDNTFRGGVC